VLGLDGAGNAGQFADYLQWEVWRDELEQERGAVERSVAKIEPLSSPQPARKKLSYLEAREYESIETRVAEAEAALQSARTAVEDPTIASDAAQLQLALDHLASSQAAADTLYARWAELEAKVS
jgi:ATP-binding cassette subfamily F protein uup